MCETRHGSLILTFTIQYLGTNTRSQFNFYRKFFSNLISLGNYSNKTNQQYPNMSRRRANFFRYESRRTNIKKHYFFVL